MMSTEQLLEILAERGLRVEVRPDGSPALKGPKEEITPALLDVIKLPEHREEILRRLAPATPPAGPPGEEKAPEAPVAVVRYPRPGSTIECLWDDGEIRLYPDGLWPLRPVAWRYPDENDWHRLREPKDE